MPKGSKSTVKSKSRKSKSKSKKASKKASAKLELEKQPKEVEEVEAEDEEEENEDDIMSIVQVLPGEEDFFSIDKNDTTLPRFCKQRRAFTKFVMKTSGIKAAIVRAIVCLYEDTSKPDNAIGYITSLLGGDLPTTDGVTNMLAKMQELRNKIEKLENENEQLRKKVEALDFGARPTIDLPEDWGEYEYEDDEQIENYQSYQPRQSSQIGSCVDSNLSFSFKW